jgi:repressor LexA
MPDPLTARQSQLLEFIQDYIQEHHMAPILSEMAEELGVQSKTSILKLLDKLEKKGYITRKKFSPRTMHVLIQGDDVYGGNALPTLPVIKPPPVRQFHALRKQVERSITFDVSQYLRYDRDACFVAAAGDDGMSKAGILRGNLLVLEERDLGTLGDGELVGVLMGKRRGRILARRFRRINIFQFELRAEGSRFPNQTISVDDKDCYVIGPIISAVHLFGERKRD